MPVIPNRVEADGRPPVPPGRADGAHYRYEMIFDGGNFRGYADTAYELVTYLIPGYDALADRDARIRARIRFALDLAVRLPGNDDVCRRRHSRCVRRMLIGSAYCRVNGVRAQGAGTNG